MLCKPTVSIFKVADAYLCGIVPYEQKMVKF